MKRHFTIMAILVFVAINIIGCSNTTDSKDQEIQAFSYNSVSGYNAYDYEKIAIEFIKNNSDFQSKYGEDFQFSFVSSMDDLKFFLSRYVFAGTAQYVIEINKDEWVIEFSKSYASKWEVIGCHLRSEES